MIETSAQVFKNLINGTEKKKQGRDTLYFKEGVLIGRATGRKYFIHLLNVAGLMKEEN